MFVLFEGIDGSGKTTISNRVAKLLRQDGVSVTHTREGGVFASSVTQSIRELGRDARNLDMTPHTELMLYAARDLQLLQETTLPALRSADVVIADRFLYSAEVLARHGRGLSEQVVRPIIDAASLGVVPDMVFLIDVDPHVARARRRVSKLKSKSKSESSERRGGSRKGLGGVGMQHRFRRGYLELAAREPQRWIVVDNTDNALDSVIRFVADTLRSALRSGAPAAVAHAQKNAPRASRLPGVAGAEQALSAFIDWIDRRAENEPSVAAYFLRRMSGPGIDARRTALSQVAPRIVADGLQGSADSVSWALRMDLRLLAPAEVARSLVGAAGTDHRADGLREMLLHEVPAAVASSIDGRDDETAWRIRERLWNHREQAAVRERTITSLKRISSGRAWQMRAGWLAEQEGDCLAAILADPGTARVACGSVSGLETTSAWEIRKAALASAPVSALGSIAGLRSDDAWRWRERFLERAPKIVLRTLRGMNEERAWEMRESAAMGAKEALESMTGMTGTRAHAMREACADVWPSTVVKSLGPLRSTPEGRRLIDRQLRRHPSQISLLKHAASAALADKQIQEAA